MEPTRELIDALYRDKIEAARRVPPDERMTMALRLSEAALARMAEIGLLPPFSPPFFPL